VTAAFIAIAVAYMMVYGGASTLAAAPQEKVTGGRYMQAGKQNNAKPGAILIVETTEQGRRSDTVLYLWEAVPFFVACLLTQIA
jgi:uncharacterized MAPEG superfamily protein